MFLPPASRTTTPYTFTEQQMTFVPTTGPKFWGKKTKPPIKVTLASHQNISHFTRQLKLHTGNIDQSKSIRNII